MDVRKVKDYASYKLKSSKLTNIHSPFLYELASKVIYESGEYYSYRHIENIRNKWLGDNTTISVNDFGAGSKIFKEGDRKIRDICRYSVKPKKYGQLLFRLINFFQPKHILELGTSLGLTTIYMASAVRNSNVISIEGDHNTYLLAKQTVKLAKVRNVELVNAKFQDALPELLDGCKQLDFVFIDGHHNKDATLAYFKLCLKKSHSETIFVFDDINWTDEMKEAWEDIKANSSITVTIDLYSMGIAFLKEGIEKQHHVLNF
jgi:predicted O-methyltransferase YrrM